VLLFVCVHRRHGARALTLLSSKSKQRPNDYMFPAILARHLLISHILTKCMRDVRLQRL